MQRRVIKLTRILSKLEGRELQFVITAVFPVRIWMIRIVKRLLMSQLMDEILRKVRELPDSERRELLGIMNSTTKSSKWEPATRAAQVELARSVRGKYAHVPTSSDSFNRRKRAEIKLENRRLSLPTRRKR